MLADLTIAQHEQYEGDDWWTWAVWLEGSDDALDAVEWVEWTLHPTFPNPVRRIFDRKAKFRLETGGWGTFTLSARVHLKAGPELKLRHALKLHYPDGTETSA